MHRTIKLAKKGVGLTKHKPLVGCVIVKDGKVLAEGYHQGPGTDHAEIDALKKLPLRAPGTILYTNLEPCCHVGDNPPCTTAIIEAGVKEVHMAIEDPNPKVAGNGRKELEKAGVKVVVGERAEEARRLNEVFFKFMTTGLPFVVAKWAMTLDGKIATKTGESKWITGEEARQRVYGLRHQYEAVLVGVNTVMTDDPELTVRSEIKNPQHPLRIVIDSQGKTPLSARILAHKLPGKTIIAATASLAREQENAFREQGTEVMCLPHRSGHRVDLKALMEELGKRLITSVMIEGGGEVIWSALEQGLVDKAYIFIGPKIIGGRESKTPVEGQGVARMREAMEWSIEHIERFGEDVMIEVYPR